MMQRLFVRSFFVLLLILSASLAFAQDNAAPEANRSAECVAEYDPDTDYFPEKARIEDAERLSVEYFNHYKVVTVTDAFVGAEPYTYVLVQCGTPTPAADQFPDETQFIEVPTRRMIAMSTTQLPHLTDLGLVDRLVGLDSFLFVNAPNIRERIDAGELVQIGSGTDVNIEVALETNPDLIMTYGFSPETDAFPRLIDAGLPTVLNAEYREPTPLGRAEWIKYTGLFFNAEATAEAAYDNIVTQYEAASELAATVPEDERPVVLWNSYSSFSDVWSIPGAETFAGALIRDAGGRVALADEAQQDSVFLSFEAVYEEALDADVWVTNLFGVTTIEGLLATDARYADFAAVQSGDVWNVGLDTNENGGDNYFELGVTNPHLILRDLVAIFHPELLPDHEFNFYLRVEEAAE